ncbi:MAG: T9SS type A sorting domain-containing protein [Flavobacteriales bacterium]|nr:hypothetical protein [Flavobacteriales bacterium]MCC6576623.1 T9SS type A sorting domain-containing protein [Flavobacteriales bacterium]NUQ15103.1 T9SS type A sorting domain-containing protein [Flavobacteriales bacterium]
MKHLITALFLACAVSVNATQWTVSNDVQAPAQFTALQQAIDSASAGDTLLVAGTGLSYGNIVVDKPLHLVGEGYWPDDAATMVEQLDIRSSNVLVTGFYATSTPFNGIKLNAYLAAGQELTDVRVTRCRGGIDLRGSNTLGSGLISNVQVDQCIIIAFNFANGWNENRFVFDTLIFRNNIFSTGFYANPNGTQTSDFIGTGTIIIDHNDFLASANGWGAFWSQYFATPAWPAGEMVVSNNIFHGTGPRGCPNCCFINNMTFNAGPEDSDVVDPLVCGGGNFWATDPGITGGQFNFNNDYTLPPGSPAIGTASDGTDIGITGGATALTLGDRPLGPEVHGLEIQEVAVPPDSVFHFLAVVLGNQDPVVPINSYEYLLDSDPGVGMGSLTFTGASDSLVVADQGVAAGLSFGSHLFGLRARDMNGSWSHTEWIPLNICTTYGPTAAFKPFLSGSTASFVDKSRYATALTYEFGDGQTSEAINPVHAYPDAGIYGAKQIALNSCGVDTAFQVIGISGLSGHQPRKAANGGLCTITLNGAGFSGAMQFSLHRAGSTLIPQSLDVVSESLAFAEFDLNGADVGYWDLELVIPGDTTHLLSNGFEVVPTEWPSQVVCTVTGPSVIRSHTWTTMNVDVHNPNGNDLFAVPVWIAYPSDLDMDMVTPVDDIVFPGSDTLQLDFQTEMLWGQPYDGTAYPVLISRIPAFSTVSLSIRTYTTQLTGAASLMAWAERPMLGFTGDETGLDQSFGPGPTNGNPSGGGSAWSCTKCFLDLVPTPPGWSCGTSIGGAINYVIGWSQVSGSRTEIANWGPVALDLAWDCGSLLAPPAAILEYLAKLKEAADFGDCIAEQCLPPLAGPKVVGLGCACDPNDKYGPLGADTDNWISPREHAAYLVAFENVDSSLFAAQRVVIKDTIDAAVFELSDARLGAIGLADSLIYAGGISQQCSQVFPLSSGYNLRVDAEIDTTTGIAQWELFIVDPVNDSLPSDPFAGFLPPNVSSPEGQGFVVLDLALKSGLPHGTIVSNKATIVFDNNPAITTGTWQNTIDSEAPSTHLAPISPITLDSTVWLEVDGDDLGCGIEWYEIYTSTDTTTGFQLWTVTDTAFVPFQGVHGVTYHFYALAVDSVGNREVKGDTTEAITQFDLTSAIESSYSAGVMRLVPNPASRELRIVLAGTGNVTGPVQLLNAIGQQVPVPAGSLVVNEVAVQSLTLDVSGLPAGAYFVVVPTATGKVHGRFVKE